MPLTAADRPRYVALVQLLPLAEQVQLPEPPDLIVLIEALCAHVPHFAEGYIVSLAHHTVTRPGEPAGLRRTYSVRLTTKALPARFAVPETSSAPSDLAVVLLEALTRRAAEMPSVLHALRAQQDHRASRGAARDAVGRACHACNLPEDAHRGWIIACIAFAGRSGYVIHDDVVSGPHARLLRGMGRAGESIFSERLREAAIDNTSQVSFGQLRKLAKDGFITLTEVPNGHRNFGSKAASSYNLTVAPAVLAAFDAEGLLLPADTPAPKPVTAEDF